MVNLIFSASASTASFLSRQREFFVRDDGNDISVVQQLSPSLHRLRLAWRSLKMVCPQFKWMIIDYRNLSIFFALKWWVYPHFGHIHMQAGAYRVWVHKLKTGKSSTQLYPFMYMFIQNSELLCLSIKSIMSQILQTKSQPQISVVPCCPMLCVLKHREASWLGPSWGALMMRKTISSVKIHTWGGAGGAMERASMKLLQMGGSTYWHNKLYSFTAFHSMIMHHTSNHASLKSSAPFWNQQWSVLLRISWNVLKQSCDEKSHCGWLVARPCPGHPGHPAQILSAMAIHGGSAGTHWLISIPAQGSMRKPWRMGHFLALDTWYSLDVVGLLKFINCGDLWCLGRPDVSSKAHLHGPKDEAGQRHHHSGEEETCRRLRPEPTEFGPLGEQSSYVQLHPPNSSKIVIEQSIKKGSRQVPRGRCQFWAAV